MGEKVEGVRGNGRFRSLRRFAKSKYLAELELFQELVMDSGETNKGSQLRVFCLLLLWVGGVLALYFLHFRLGIYHEGSSWHYIMCAIFGLPVLGIACGCPIVIVWLWMTRFSRLRKVCLTVIAISITIPLVWSIGFVWLILHMAP